MRQMTKKNKIAAAAASVALVAVGGGAAYAYWSTTGSGNGSAAAATGTQAVTINVTVAPNVAPGSPKTITYTATNPNSSSTLVTLANPQVTATDKSGCLPEWFTATVPVDANGVATTTTVAGNAPAAALGTGMLTLADLPGTDQNACKGATVSLSVDSH